ncbi:HAMP domain-containing protein [Halomonas sp. ML-15]|uniref:methyl-accepting chemotaxis protein n=1 Tax=Halomonas sp. ML-15 TaxID=2773305 RepID=UPI00174708EC|nr:methyl-accepting chemotaxis protein [Halomonas sp. ML-15]MBD3895089.1 HAMP domain-containing protein [Halomonas sp. ML-15]
MAWLARLSLTQKLLAATAIPLLLASIVLGTIVQQQLNRTVPTLVENAGTRQIEARADEIARWIEGYRSWLTALAQDERLQTDVPVGEHLEWLESRHPGDATIESFYFADASGDTVTHTGATTDITERDYFQTLVTQGTQDRLLADPVISLISGEPTAIIAETIFDDAGNRVGLLGITLSMAAVSEITSAIDVGDGSYGWMIDSEGTVVAHPEEDARMTLNLAQADQHGYAGMDTLGQTMLAGEAGMGQVGLPDGDHNAVMWHPIDGTPWVAGVNVPATTFTAVTTQLLRTLLIAGVLTLAVLLVIVAVAARRALAPIKHTAAAMADIAAGKGDLTRRLEVRSHDEVGELAVQFNAFVERMQSTLREVRGNAQTVLSGASDIADGTHELSSRTEQAAANLQQTSASMEEIHSTVAHTSQASEQANGLAGEAASATQRGTTAMDQMETKMAAISDSAKRISEIIGLIDSIAFQTNILALNASVEAARAGEQGRGFAVVAGEVRTLASRSADAARDIRKLIDASVNHTQEGSGIAKDAAERMQEIRHSITQVSDVIAEIAAGAREQTSGIDQINTAVAEMDTMTQQNAAMVSQNATLAGGMRDNAQRLDTLMAEFVLGDDSRVPLAAPTNRHTAQHVGRASNPAASKELPRPSTRTSADRETEWETF